MAPMDGGAEIVLFVCFFFCTQGLQLDFYPIGSTKIDTKV